jgi:hypothetical protein
MCQLKPRKQNERQHPGLLTAAIPLALNCPRMRKTGAHILIIAASGCGVLHSMKESSRMAQAAKCPFFRRPSAPSRGGDHAGWQAAEKQAVLQQPAKAWTMNIL